MRVPERFHVALMCISQLQSHKTFWCIGTTAETGSWIHFLPYQLLLQRVNLILEESFFCCCCRSERFPLLLLFFTIISIIAIILWTLAFYWFIWLSFSTALSCFKWTEPGGPFLLLFLPPILISRQSNVPVDLYWQWKLWACAPTIVYLINSYITRQWSMPASNLHMFISRS